ncbi:MAG: hypothetical protein ACYDBY_14135 [Thermoanaerobaculia bacterium]
MNRTGPVRTARLVFRATLVSLLLAAGGAAAQTCPTGSTIPNFRFVSSTKTVPRQITYAWGVPTGAPAGTVYEVLRGVATDYCSNFSPLAVIAETTATTYTVTLDSPDVVYEFWVRVKGCTVGAPGAWIDDSFVLPPSSPFLTIPSTAANQVTLSITQDDARTAGIVLERVDPNGTFRQIATLYFHDLCPAGSTHTLTDSGLAPGTYSYRAWAFNQGSSRQVFSTVATVTVSGAFEAPPVVGFYSANPAAISPGDASTLSWSTTGGDTASIDHGIGPVSTSGSVVVRPTVTTTYTLTVTGAGGPVVSRVQVIVTPIPLPGEVAATIVTVASSPGLYGSYYRTAVQLSNPSDNLAFGRLVYHPKERSGSTGDSFVRYTLRARQTLQFPNILGLIGTSGSGSLDVVPEGGAIPVVRARVYNDAGALGTMGVTEYGLPPSEALAAGETGLLLGPSDLQKFRFSVGLRTLEAGATLTFTLRDESGSVTKVVTENYPGTYYIQRSASELFDGALFTGDDSVTVEVSAGSVFVYSTVADNLTNDPSMQIAKRLP